MGPDIPTPHVFLSYCSVRTVFWCCSHSQMLTYPSSSRDAAFLNNAGLFHDPATSRLVLVCVIFAVQLMSQMEAKAQNTLEYEYKKFDLNLRMYPGMAVD